MEYRERQAQHRRLTILQALNQASGYSQNTSILHDVVGDCGFAASHDAIDADVDWLADAGLVRAETLAVGTLRVVTITQRGADVAAGEAQATGVARPSPD